MTISLLLGVQTHKKSYQMLLDTFNFWTVNVVISHRAFVAKQAIVAFMRFFGLVWTQTFTQIFRTLLRFDSDMGKKLAAEASA